WRVARPGQPLGGAPGLLDPWARAVSDARWDRRAAPAGAPLGESPRAVVTARPQKKPVAHSPDPSDAVIYELHVGGFTRHPSAGVRHPGTFAGLVEKIPYLKELGITHVELLPVMAFDEQAVPPRAAARGLVNYWGYNTVGFHAPHPRYCVDPPRAPQPFHESAPALHQPALA